MKGGFQILLDRKMLNNIQKLRHNRWEEEDDCVLCTLYYLGLRDIKDLIKIVEKSDDGISDNIWLNKIIEHINYLKKNKPEKILYDENLDKDITLSDIKIDNYNLFTDREFVHNYLSFFEKDEIEYNSIIRRIKFKTNFENFLYGNSEDLANHKFYETKYGVRVNIYDELYRKWCYKILKKIFRKIHPGYATLLTIDYRWKLEDKDEEDKDEEDEEDKDEEFSTPPKVGEIGYFSSFGKKTTSDEYIIMNENKEINVVHFSMKNQEEVDEEDDYFQNKGKITKILHIPNKFTTLWLKTEDISHALIIFKDLNSNVYFIDNQTGELYKGFKEIYEEYLKFIGVYNFQTINTNIYLSSVDKPNKTIPGHTAIFHSFDVEKEQIKQINTIEDLELQIKSLENFIKNETSVKKIKKVNKKIKQLKELINISKKPKPGDTLVHSR